MQSSGERNLGAQPLARLMAERGLNPADLARRITDIQNQLIRLAERRTQTDQPAA